MHFSWIRPVAFYAMLALIGLTGAFGDATLNNWAKSSNFRWLWLSYGIWLVVATLFGLVLRWQRFSFSGAVALALVVHTITVTFIDRVYYGRQFSTWELMGLACAGVAIAAFEVGSALQTTAN